MCGAHTTFCVRLCLLVVLTLLRNVSAGRVGIITPDTKYEALVVKDLVLLEGSLHLPLYSS